MMALTSGRETETLAQLMPPFFVKGQVLKIKIRTAVTEEPI
jgi:hypothetical protein